MSSGEPGNVKIGFIANISFGDSGPAGSPGSISQLVFCNHSTPLPQFGEILHTWHLNCILYLRQPPPPPRSLQMFSAKGACINVTTSDLDWMKQNIRLFPESSTTWFWASSVFWESGQVRLWFTLACHMICFLYKQMLSQQCYVMSLWQGLMRRPLFLWGGPLPNPLPPSNRDKNIR